VSSFDDDLQTIHVFLVITTSSGREHRVVRAFSRDDFRSCFSSCMSAALIELFDLVTRETEGENNVRLSEGSVAQTQRTEAGTGGVNGAGEIATGSSAPLSTEHDPALERLPF
jgi:hypothetical protein